MMIHGIRVYAGLFARLILGIYAPLSSCAMGHYSEYLTVTDI